MFVHHISFNRTDDCHLLIYFIFFFRWSQDFVISKLINLDPRKAGSFTKLFDTRNEGDENSKIDDILSQLLKNQSDFVLISNLNSCIQSIYLLVLNVRCECLQCWISIRSYHLYNNVLRPCLYVTVSVFSSLLLSGFYLIDNVICSQICHSGYQSIWTCFEFWVTIFRSIIAVYSVQSAKSFSQK